MEIGIYTMSPKSALHSRVQINGKGMFSIRLCNLYDSGHFRLVGNVALQST